tara:strand:- start:128 stop:682 length:555 start_codon:yes stop_codon:yes gene_type:complete
MEQDYRRSKAQNGFLTINKRLLNIPQLKNLKKQINKHIQIFMYEKLKVEPKIKFKITNSWALKHVKGDYTHPHNHANSLISGVMYLKTIENEKGGALTFHKNSSWHNIFPLSFNAEFTEHNFTTCDRFTIGPKPGAIILFPSSLNHSVAANQSDKIRCSVAFNIYVDGDIGLKDNTDEIRIKST